MPTITANATVSAIQSKMLARLAARKGKTLQDALDGLLAARINQLFAGEVEDALEELRGGAITAESEALLKDYVTSKAPPKGP